MLYPYDIEDKIDFGFIRHKLLSYCSFEYGSRRVEEMHFLTDFATISELLTITKEMLDLLADKSFDYPDGAKHDVSASLKRLRVEGLYMEEQELHLLRLTLETIRQQAHFFSSLPEERFPLLRLITSNYNTQLASVFIEEIDRLLDKYGAIRDNASAELSRIRKELRQAEGSVSRLLSQILRRAQSEGYVDSDASPTMREGRLVIPITPAYKRKLGGIVHDESASGKTVYIEPTEVVEANNRIRELENEELREKKRILLAFADKLRPHLSDLVNCMEFLGDTDFLHAKAMLARELQAIAPVINDLPQFDWRGARHPMLLCNFREQGKELVPLNIRLTDENRILVISGPNAGGKSVCLKTVALLQYMMQCGLLVPLREDSTMGLFSDIMIDIGDSQSIDDDLSTYSSHLRNMKTFLRQANEHSLVLIDEFGSGTEPLMGGAIAEAILLQINQQKARGVITTHYTNLKHLAGETEGIVNGAMLYDRGQLRPLFILSIGHAGSSFAIEIAHQIGLPLSIIDKAKELVGEEKIDYDKQLQDIARDRRYWENKRQQVKQREKHLEERIEYYEGQIANIKTTKREIIDKAKEQAASLLERTNATIENTIREIKETKANSEKTKKARAEVEKLKQEVAQPATAKGKKGNSKKTQTETPAADDKKKKVFRDFSDLRQLSGKSIKETRLIDSNLHEQHSVSDEIRRKKLTFKQEIDLRGMRADEALQAIESYIDDAVMVATDEVRILHGTGTGALKQVVRAYLQNNHRVRGFHDGDPDKGGAGITIVEF